MSLNNGWVVFLKICTAAMSFVVTLGCAAQTRIGPNIRVSRNSNDPRVESKIAANPQNPKNLIATSIVSGALLDTCVVYTSLDGGNTWREIAINDLPENGSGDPQVAFGEDGTAYFSTLGRIRSANGTTPSAIVMYRSGDGGINWRKVAEVGAGHTPDHDELVTDSRRDHAQRIFVAALLNDWKLGLFQSMDGGVNFAGPAIAATGNGSGLLSLSPIVFSDGSLFLPFLRFELKELEKRNPPGEDVMFVSSTDGMSFSAAHKIVSIPMNPSYRFASPYPSVEFAADTRSLLFRGRVYVVWGESVGDHYVVRFVHSKDRGGSWSTPRTVSEVRGAEQFRPAIAVNAAGVVGVSWFDSRLADGKEAYDEFFASSADGGESFQPAVRVSRESSVLRPVGNLVLKPTIDSRRTAGSDGQFTLAFNETNDRFPDEGDYMGLAADAGGIFHPFWSDTRTGSSQAWTASVVVPGARDDYSRTSTTSTKSISKAIEVVLDPALLDAANGIEEIPIRLRNLSDTAVCKPLVVEVKALEADVGTPELINSANGIRGKVAQMDYSGALGDFACLAPGAVTEALAWRIKLADPRRRFVFLTFTVNAAEPAP